MLSVDECDNNLVRIIVCVELLRGCWWQDATYRQYRGMRGCERVQRHLS